MNYLVKNRLIVKFCVLTCCASIVAVTPALAATTSAPFQVTATVLSACVLTTPPPLVFLNYTPSGSTASNATTTFAVVCSLGTPYSLGLNAGQGGSATVTTRKMTNLTGTVGSNLLEYGLFKDSARSVNWDNTIDGAGYLSTGLVQPYTVYGSIPAGQYSAAAALSTYTDTVLLTLTY